MMPSYKKCFQEMEKRKDFHFDLNFLKASLRIKSKLFIEGSYYAILFVVFNLIISISSEVVGYYLGLIPGRMYSALLSKDVDSFWFILWSGSLMYVGKCFLLAALSSASWLLYLCFRKNLTTSLTKAIFYAKTTAYKLFCLESLDNLDQRITQDVDKMCTILANTLLPAVMICPFVIVYYTYKTYVTAGIYGCGIIYGYFFIGTCINKMLISPLSKWTARVEKVEGDYRYKYATLRDNIEQISLYGGNEFEKDSTYTYLNKILKAQFYLGSWIFPNTMFQTFFSYYGGLLSYAIQFIAIFWWHIYDDLSPQDLAKVISNNAFVYIYLVNSFTRLSDTSIAIGEMAGLLQRIDEVFVACRGLRYSTNITHDKDNNLPLITVNNVSISTTSAKLIINKLNIMSNGNLLILGPSGAGKSSLVRMFLDVWRIDEGIVNINMASDQISVIPQKGYFPTGKLTLYEQICFPKIITPGTPIKYEEEEIIFELIGKLHLNSVLARVGGLHIKPNFEYNNVLTPGELQRLSFIRALINKPKLVFLDESTNSVSNDVEEIMYTYLIKNDIRVVSVGHRDTLLKWHAQVLILDGTGGYTCRDI
uniref:ABC transporter domain-containing protein n=1 Tax=Rhabditophanes sp. KR3021 TaxID=114890 RepID=A0AC35TQL5_9BILA